MSRLNYDFDNIEQDADDDHDDDEIDETDIYDYINRNVGKNDSHVDYTDDNNHQHHCYQYDHHIDYDNIDQCVDDNDDPGFDDKL